MLKNWAVVPTYLRLAIRCRHMCAAERFRASSKVRVNANHLLLDAWLFVIRTACLAPAKLTVLERMNLRLHATRGAGPVARQRCRPDSRAAPAFGRAMPHSHPPRLGLRLAPGHRQIGSR